MNKIMSPSEKIITNRQAGKFADRFVTALVKSGLPAGPIQEVLEEVDSLSDIFVALVRERVEAKSNMFVRHVKVDRTIPPQVIIAATGRKVYCNQSVLAEIPKGEGDEVPVTFFKPAATAYDKNGLISDDAIAAEYKLRKLKPDPRAQIAANQADEGLADNFPNVSLWKDVNSNYCYVIFSLTNRWHGAWDVYVHQRDGPWVAGDWLVGVPE
jgi:hypothetical protein